VTVELEQKRALVVGLGKSGFSAARLLSSKGARVVLNDVRELGKVEGLEAFAQSISAETVLGHHPVELFTSVDLVVVSPGVPPLPALDAATAAGVLVISEIELASRFVRAKIAAVTGTNGKSTVTSLLGEMAQKSAVPTFVGGNLGTPFAEAAGTLAADSGFSVLELSSFQLERVDRFRANVAVLLNVTDDHLDRYEDFGAYAAAKAQIFKGQTADDYSVVPAGDALCLSLARAGKATVLTFGEGGDACVEDGALVDRESGARVTLDELHIVGSHNHENACAAMLAARALGISRETIEEALRGFRGLPHRMERVGVVRGVTFIDDSKATNVGAAVAALAGLSRDPGSIVLIAGGRDKGGSYTPLRDPLTRKGRALITLGEAAGLVEAELGELLPTRRVRDMSEAVRMAMSLAEEGDVVLLSPACASLDMYRSYAERGDVFQRAVRSLEEAT
jgi:UDP-N-acetylmuramoylalanine--D-glutamate ligase